MHNELRHRPAAGNFEIVYLAEVDRQGTVVRILQDKLGFMRKSPAGIVAMIPGSFRDVYPTSDIAFEAISEELVTSGKVAEPAIRRGVRYCDDPGAGANIKSYSIDQLLAQVKRPGTSPEQMFGEIERRARVHDGEKVAGDDSRPWLLCAGEYSDYTVLGVHLGTQAEAESIAAGMTSERADEVASDMVRVYVQPTHLVRPLG